MIFLGEGPHVRGVAQQLAVGLVVGTGRDIAWPDGKTLKT